MINTNSDTWITIKQDIKNDLISCRSKLESKGCTDSEYIRGKIAAYKRILALPDKKPTEISTIEDYT